MQKMLATTALLLLRGHTVNQLRAQAACQDRPINHGAATAELTQLGNTTI